MIESSPTSSARVLNEVRDDVLTEWEKRLRAEVKSASNLRQPVLINTVPAFIDKLAEALSQDHPRTLATESSTISQEHGGERARLTRYGPDQLIREYQILHEVIVDELQEKTQVTVRDRRIIQKSFDKAIQEGMLAFFLVHSRIREQFVAGLGHDLRNPLGAAKMSGELILMATDEEVSSEGWEDVRGLAQRVVTNAKRADRLIQDLLDASVIQIGEKLALNIGEYEILGIIKESIADIDRNEKSRIQVNGMTARGFWGGETIRRAVENLVTNAIKYGTPGTPILITVESINGRMILSVHNDGTHIPAEEQEGLFEPFRRSQAARTGKTRGWGLGLALVRSVAEGHGGSIGVDSSPEIGTTFVFDIPLDARPFQDAPTTGGTSGI